LEIEKKTSKFAFDVLLLNLVALAFSLLTYQGVKSLNKEIHWG
jgi:hypothetical protein